MRTIRTSTGTLRTLSSAFFLLLACILLCAATAMAAPLTGVVTNRTTGKPSAGDTVTLVAPMSGMAEVAHATTDASGRYSLNVPDAGAYLVRAVHQGTPFLIAAPSGGPNASGDISVYDVAAKVHDLSLVADVYELEAQNGQLAVEEQFIVSNTSSPPMTQFSGNTFEIVLPENAVVDEASASRPGGLPTTVELKPLPQKRHFSINVPIQPDQGDQETEFLVRYHMPYSGQATISPTLLLPVRHEIVFLPRDMKFSGGSGTKYQVPQDPRFPKDPNTQTFMADSVQPGQSLQFTVSGNGSLPQEQAQGADQSANGQASNGSRPGGGLGAPDDPNATHDPWAQSKWWILGTLGVALVLGAGVMLKAGQPNAAIAVAGAAPPLASAEGSAPVATQAGVYAAGVAAAPAAVAAAGQGALLRALKDELFVLETDRLAGRLGEAEYAEHKAAFDVVLRRALARSEAAPGASDE
jgi:hypothetical protein